ncbi:hypothetical protein [Paracoccus sp. T5]
MRKQLTVFAVLLGTTPLAAPVRGKDSGASYLHMEAPGLAAGDPDEA